MYNGSGCNEMPSPEASRRNLTIYWSRVGRPRSRDESILHWWLTLRWWTQDEPREPRTEAEWAALLGVSQPYISKMVSRFKLEWLELASKWTGWQDATLDDLRRARERRQRTTEQMAEARSWERYDAERRRNQHAAERRHEHPYSFARTVLDECSDEN